MAKLSQLLMSKFINCSMLGDNDGNKRGEVLGNLDDTLLGKYDGNAVVGSKLGGLLGALESSALGEDDGTKTKLGFVLGDLEGSVLGTKLGCVLGRTLG
jgi:hypothetical protein